MNDFEFYLDSSNEEDHALEALHEQSAQEFENDQDLD